MEEHILRDLLLKQHKEELDDCEMYTKLAEEAYEAGYECTSGVLEDIAHEEHTHANAIKHLLEKEVF